MVGELFQKIAQMLNTDLSTLYKSVTVGSTSTAVGAVAKAANQGWETQIHLIDIFWALLTCVLLTLTSLLITDLYKTIKKRICKNKGE
jgi:hypothetical protein